MTITDIESYWKQDVRLKDRLGEENGDYIVTFGEAKVESRREGMYEILEIPVVETLSRNEAKISLFYYSSNEFNENVIDRLKKLTDLVDPSIRQQTSTFGDSLNALSAALFGRTGTVKQTSKTNEGTGEIKIFFEVLDVDPAVPLRDQYPKAAAMIDKAVASKNTSLETDSDIPF